VRAARIRLKSTKIIKQPGGSMKRAVVWLCWGQRFVAEAAESARTAATLEMDRFLITDAAGADQAKESGAFTSIIPTRLRHVNNLEKSRLIDLIPAGYDSFLYLDCDTRIVGDVMLGFEMAERHGIAVAPAPNYNLGEYFGFGHFMAQAGMEPADQMIYNAGVIFFHLSPTVRRVLERWRDLCDTIGADAGFAHDQPFLTMAFEQLAFLPYVLSPLYNYRSMGEYAVGSIRIWHSRFPLPDDLNTFDQAWPARRFIDGVRARGGNEEYIREVKRQSPRAMLRPKLLGSGIIAFTRANALSIASTALSVQRERGSRQATKYLIGHLGVETSTDLDERYFAEAFSYHLGLLYAHFLHPEGMAEHISRSHTMPSSDDDLWFSDHVNASRETNDHRKRAIRRGMPPILFSCMPRSASATMTHILGQVFDVPVVHVCIGRFPNYFFAPSWLDMFLEGGAITQDHFGASDFNIGVLSGRGSRNLFVLVRDPRAAARSQVHYHSPPTADARQSLEARIELECVAHFIPWLQGWIDCSRNPDVPFRIHWLTFREVCRDPAAVLRKVVRVLQEDYPALSIYADCQKVPDLRLHYVTGNDDAWRAEVGDRTRERLWAACTQDIRSLLALEP
jgi:hypothetical protein